MKDVFHEVANLFIRSMKFDNAGDDWQDLEGHVHTYDHAHFISNGSMRIVVNGIATDYTAPALVLIKAGLHHRMIALEPGTIGHCIHALRSADMSGEPYDPTFIPEGARASELSAPLTRHISEGV